MPLLCMAGLYKIVGRLWLIVASCAVGVAGIKSSSLAILGSACHVASRHSCQPNGLVWVLPSPLAPRPLWELTSTAPLWRGIVSHSWDSGRLLLIPVIPASRFILVLVVGRIAALALLCSSAVEMVCSCCLYCCRVSTWPSVVVDAWRRRSFIVVESQGGGCTEVSTACGGGGGNALGFNSGCSVEASKWSNSGGRTKTFCRFVLVGRFSRCLPVGPLTVTRR
jgi:hypothetical protein